MHNKLSVLYVILLILYINDISQFLSDKKIEIPNNINESWFKDTLKQSLGYWFYAENLSKKLSVFDITKTYSYLLDKNLLKIYGSVKLFLRVISSIVFDWLDDNSYLFKNLINGKSCNIADQKIKIIYIFLFHVI